VLNSLATLFNTNNRESVVACKQIENATYTSDTQVHQLSH